VRAFHYRCRYDAVRSTSGNCSPRRRVVPVSLKARKLILPGITTGIIGYALEYLGIALVSFSKRWGIARPALQRQCSDRTPTVQAFSRVLTLGKIDAEDRFCANRQMRDCALAASKRSAHIRFSVRDE